MRYKQKLEVNKRYFENLCGIQCTFEEICSVLEVSPVALRGWVNRTYGTGFREVFSIYRNKGKASLRRTQFKLAEKNAAMAIFLGKNILGQTEKVEENHSLEITDNTPSININFISDGSELDSENP